MQNHKYNEVENAFPIFKVSRLVKLHTDSHHNRPVESQFGARENYARGAPRPPLPPAGCLAPESNILCRQWSFGK